MSQAPEHQKKDLQSQVEAQNVGGAQVPEAEEKNPNTSSFFHRPFSSSFYCPSPCSPPASSFDNTIPASSPGISETSFHFSYPPTSCSSSSSSPLKMGIQEEVEVIDDETLRASRGWESSDVGATSQSMLDQHHEFTKDEITELSKRPMELFLWARPLDGPDEDLSKQYETPDILTLCDLRNPTMYISLMQDSQPSQSMGRTTPLLTFLKDNLDIQDDVQEPIVISSSSESQESPERRESPESHESVEGAESVESAESSETLKSSESPEIIICSSSSSLDENVGTQCEVQNISDTDSSVSDKEEDSSGTFQASAPLIDPQDKKVSELVQYLLLKHQSKESFTEEELLAVVIKEFQNEFATIFKRACECLETDFDIHVKEADPTIRSYVLLNALDFTYDEVVNHDKKIPKNGLLLIILGLIVKEGYSISEKDLWEVLEIMGMHARRKHALFGNIRQLITREWVKKRYLAYRQARYIYPPHYEFLWGPRAYAETTTAKVLGFLAKINGTDVNSIVS